MITREDGPKIVSEFIGTFTIVFAGCGAIMVAAQIPGGTSFAAIPVVFGCAVAIMIYALGHVSGAHFNPAVTAAFAAVGRFPWRQVPLYWFGQIAGAIAATALLTYLMPPVANYGATHSSLTSMQALVWEVVLTFLLMLVISGTATDTRAQGVMAGLAIGGAVMLDAFIGGAATGASMNPVRSLAPALFSGRLDDVWIYMAGPVIGAVLAAWIYEYLREFRDDRHHIKSGRNS